MATLPVANSVCRKAPKLYILYHSAITPVSSAQSQMCGLSTSKKLNKSPNDRADVEVEPDRTVIFLRRAAEIELKRPLKALLSPQGSQDWEDSLKSKHWTVF